ncbi:MAG: hypothetical protein ACR2FO_05085 [Actinomycetota bacterium]
MSMRKVQLYLTDNQYRLLKQTAGQKGSIAQVVRDLIDRSVLPEDVGADAFYRHVTSKKTGSGPSYRAEEAKRDLYRKLR